jgi:hypothetical protein
MSDTEGICDVCGASGASHQFDILKHSGGGAVDTCDECTGLAKRLGGAVKTEFCLWCLEPTNQKYEWLTYGEAGDEDHRICGDCRKEIIFTPRPLSRGVVGWSE